jgi:hypothetical protein
MTYRMSGVTPTELAASIDASAGYSTSSLAKRIRKVARRLFPGGAPGQGGRWRAFSDDQVAAILRCL